MQDLLGLRNSRDSSPPPAVRSCGSEALGIFFDQVLAEYADDSLKAELSSRAWKEVDKAAAIEIGTSESRATCTSLPAAKCGGRGARSTPGHGGREGRAQRPDDSGRPGRV